MSARGAGKPLLAVVALLSGWVAVRMAVWEPPFPLPSPEALFAQAEAGESAAATAFADGDRLAGASEARAYHPLHSAIGQPALPAIGVGAGQDGVAVPPGLAFAGSAIFGQLARSQRSASHQWLYAEALGSAASSDAPQPAWFVRPGTTAPGLRQPFQPPRPLGWRAAASSAQTPPFDGGSARGRALDRWSADGWLLVREGERGERLASVNPASYGSDQIGAVVRYGLSPGSALQPQIYGRASKALVRDGEAELAAGLSVALARGFPLRLHGEVRVTDRPGALGGRTEVRPAAYVVTGLPRQDIAPGLEAESYLQAGYVGGDFETGFVDGKATLEAPLLRTEKGRLAVGAGVWGGAQRDASRLDAGPTASVVLARGKASLRASVDYRFRLAGDASPGDGVAVTLAASF